MRRSEYTICILRDSESPRKRFSVVFVHTAKKAHDHYDNNNSFCIPRIVSFLSNRQQLIMSPTRRTQSHACGVRYRSERFRLIHTIYYYVYAKQKWKKKCTDSCKKSVRQQCYYYTRARIHTIMYLWVFDARGGGGNRCLYIVHSSFYTSSARARLFRSLILSPRVRWCVWYHIYIYIITIITTITYVHIIYIYIYERRATQ